MASTPPSRIDEITSAIEFRMKRDWSERTRASTPSGSFAAMKENMRRFSVFSQRSLGPQASVCVYAAAEPAEASPAPIMGSVSPQGRVVRIDPAKAASTVEAFQGDMADVLGEIPERETALKEIFEALKPNGLLSVTEVIFDPHFQSRNTVQELAEAVGFREKECFGNRLAYTMILEKPYET